MFFNISNHFPRLIMSINNRLKAHWWKSVWDRSVFLCQMMFFKSFLESEVRRKPTKKCFGWDRWFVSPSVSTWAKGGQLWDLRFKINFRHKSQILSNNFFKIIFRVRSQKKTYQEMFWLRQMKKEKENKVKHDDHASPGFVALS